MSEYGGDDDDYGDDDFDDYEFEDFEDSETEEKDETLDVTESAYHDAGDVDAGDVDADIGKDEGSSSDHNQEDLNSTSEHNQQVLAKLNLDVPSESALEENPSSVDVNLNSDDDKVDVNVNANKYIGENTLVHSISTELRQMMLDEERQNKENVRVGSPVNGPASGRAAVDKKHQSKNQIKNKKSKHTKHRVRSPARLLPGEKGLTDQSSSLIEGSGPFTNNMSSIEASVISPSKILNGPGSEAWKSQLDSYSTTLEKCVENEKKRIKGSSFIQSHVSHEAKHHRSIVERQLRCALQQVNSYRKENNYLTKMIDASSIHSDFNALRVKNDEQSLIIKQLTDERRSLLLVQRNQEKSLLETEKEKEAQPEQEHINRKKMSVFQKKVKTLRDNLYHYQVKTREEMSKNKHLTEQNTKLKVKLKALMITQSVAEQLKRDKLGLTDDQDQSQSCNLKFDSLGVGEESVVKPEDTTVHTEKEENFEELRNQRNRLKSIVENQRASFRHQLVVLQSKLERSLLKRKELEDELVRREKEMRAQIFAVKELNKTCEELTKSNMELLEASSLYSKKMRRTVQSGPPVHPAPRPTPPSQSFAHRPSPVMARPKEAVMATENTFLTGQNFEDCCTE
jgi:hypothetical protein